METNVLDLQLRVNVIHTKHYSVCNLQCLSAVTNRFAGVSGVLLDSRAVFLLAVVDFDDLSVVEPCLADTLHQAQAHTKLMETENRIQSDS